MKTQPPHDLSADTTKISFPLLLELATIAVHYSKIECERALGEIQNFSFANNFNGLHYSAAKLAMHAEALASASNTLCVLTESKCRSKLIIIGKPPVASIMINK